MGKIWDGLAQANGNEQRREHLRGLRQVGRVVSAGTDGFSHRHDAFGSASTQKEDCAALNIPGKSLKALIVEYRPGGASSPHIHAKSAFIFGYVLSEEIESQVNDGPKRVYRAGESFYETPGSRHLVSRNASKTKPARRLAVWVVDTDEKELTISIEEDSSPRHKK